jgi:hypothetical protein
MPTPPKPPNPTAAYLAKLGVKVKESDLVAPDLDTLLAASDAPFEWLDRHGKPVPPDLEFYRVEHLPGDQGRQVTERTIREKEQREGFALLEPGHGFHMRDLHTPDSESIMIRTQERAQAYRRAEIERLRRRRGRRVKTRHPAGAAGSIDMEVTYQGEATLPVPPPAGLER